MKTKILLTVSLLAATACSMTSAQQVNIDQLKQLVTQYAGTAFNIVKGFVQEFEAGKSPEAILEEALHQIPVKALVGILAQGGAQVGVSRDQINALLTKGTIDDALRAKIQSALRSPQVQEAVTRIRQEINIVTLPVALSTLKALVERNVLPAISNAVQKKEVPQGFEAAFKNAVEYVFNSPDKAKFQLIAKNVVGIFDTIRDKVLSQLATVADNQQFVNAIKGAVSQLQNSPQFQDIINQAKSLDMSQLKNLFNQFKSVNFSAVNVDALINEVRAALHV
jgi:hypothetical protein